MDYTNINSKERVRAKISLNIEKTIDTLTASEADDVKQADCDALRALGYRVTGLSFFYDQIPTEENADGK